jgi:uncharacterized protein YbaR (Trm112 family)
MPIGCDFICENEACEVYKCRISIHGPWPISSIEEAIASEEDPSRKKALEAKQTDGIKHACIAIPNKSGIKSCGIRLKLYCPTCKMLWDQDYLGTGATEIVAEDLERPKPCPECKGKVLSLVRAREDGLPCPLCSKPMKAKSWMTSGEKAKKDGDPNPKV